jgi:hypothetical protein
MQIKNLSKESQKVIKAGSKKDKNRGPISIADSYICGIL